MLTIFNRRELLTVLSQEQLFQIQSVLKESDIVCFAVPMQQGGRFRRHGLFTNGDALYQYKVYVHKNDWNRAKQTIRAAL